MHPSNDLIVLLPYEVEQVVDLVNVESYHAHVLVESGQVLKALFCIWISKICILLNDLFNRGLMSQLLLDLMVLLLLIGLQS